ncbi:phage holin family protein [Gilliamella sp. W8136]|uniref:Phage holin family protein n=1 Tax=Gilliamella apicola TaxID=1196095 RepID=A0A556S914_9GAMM|nr:phage holin family protein [Gilliamella sp. W8136]TSJ97639.1 phage holin family protein [Gilliamella apicola]
MTTLNAVLCFLIAVRLFTFDRKNCKYNAKISWLAWLMITSSASVFIFSFFDFPHRAHYAQTIMNMTLLICFIKSKGNMAILCRKKRGRQSDNK